MKKAAKDGEYARGPNRQTTWVITNLGTNRRRFWKEGQAEVEVMKEEEEENKRRKRRRRRNKKKIK